MTHRSRAIDRLHHDGGISEQPRLNTGLPADVDTAVAQRVAESGCAVLITGETGVGKGRLARWLHDHSPRARGPFIPINCGAIPETLIDSQLFGHARGAFSGAHTEHLGLVRAAEGGTLLLDEVSELPSSAQMRLLRLLQEREVQPVGRATPVIVDVRVITATNIDLAEAVAERRFREDLLFRLDVVRLRVPALRERMHELPALARAFNAEFAAIYGQPELTFEPEAMEILRAYHWPGNIRQLRSLIERLHVLCCGKTIGPLHILELGQLQPLPRNGGSAAATMARFRLEHVRRVLLESNGSVARAAEAFGVHRSTIYRWLRES